MGEIPYDFKSWQEFVANQTYPTYVLAPGVEVGVAGGYYRYPHYPEYPILNIGEVVQEPSTTKASRKTRFATLIKGRFGRAKKYFSKPEKTAICPTSGVQREQGECTKWYIDPSNIETEAEQMLATQFSSFRKGTIKSKNISVVIKSSNGIEYIRQSLNEIRILAKLQGHANIVQLYGYSSERQDFRNGDVVILLGFCEFGSLLTFVGDGELGEMDNRRWPNVFTVADLYRWSLDILNGLEFIHSHNILHCDIALRNVLLADDGTAKLSDFGMSIILEEGSSYEILRQNQPFPLRWAAIETLKNCKVSKRSDIWSFGVTLWELFNLGRSVPYGVDAYNDGFEAIVRYLDSGLRLDKPEYATQTLYDEVMMRCWDMDEIVRPSIPQMKQKIFNSLAFDQELQGNRPVAWRYNRH